VEAVLASPAVNEEGSTVERKTSQERRHNPPERRGQERRSHVDAHLLDTRAKQERRLNSRRTEEQEAPAPETPSVPRKGIDVLA
jgi:hypothetical protein